MATITKNNNTFCRGHGDTVKDGARTAAYWEMGDGRDCPFVSPLFLNRVSITMVEEVK